MKKLIPIFLLLTTIACKKAIVRGQVVPPSLDSVVNYIAFTGTGNDYQEFLLNQAPKPDSLLLRLEVYAAFTIDSSFYRSDNIEVPVFLGRYNNYQDVLHTTINDSLHYILNYPILDTTEQKLFVGNGTVDLKYGSSCLVPGTDSVVIKVIYFYKR